MSGFSISGAYLLHTYIYIYIYTHMSIHIGLGREPTTCGVIASFRRRLDDVSLPHWTSMHA
jgi:hypothetical protein